MRRFSLLLIVLSFVCAMEEGRALEPPGLAAKEETPKEAGDATRHDFGNFSFELPKGWKIVKSDRKKTEAMLVLGGPERFALKGMIKVDAGKPAEPTSKALADSFAKSVGSTAESKDAELDGVAAARLDTGTHSIAEPGIFVAAVRGKRAYLLMGAAANGVDLDAAIETIQRTWKWSGEADAE